MSSSGLARMTKRVLNRLEAVDMRSKVQDYEGQLFIWDRQTFINAMSAETTPENVEKLVKIWQKSLKSQDARQMRIKAFKNRLLKAKEYIKTAKVENYSETTHEIYAVFNYETVQRIKREVGAEFSKLTGKDAKIVTGRLDKGDLVEDLSGTQIGHGEFGSAVSTTKVFSAESVMKTKTSLSKYSDKEAYKNIEKSIENYKRTLGISLETKHYQEVTARGKLTKVYTPILSSQDAKDNLKDAIGEKEALKALIASVREEYKFIAEQEGSETLVEAIGSVTAYNLSKGKNVTSKGKVKAKPIVKSSTKSRKQKGKVEVSEKLKVASGAGATRSKRRGGRSKRSSFNLTTFLGILNQQLPNVVAKNMGSPALNYRTGRFASGVRVTDISKTPQGFPSIGYTYQLYPYQTFEPGYVQGDPERDPRKLIDRSIREIMAQYAIGRFYTRRQ